MDSLATPFRRVSDKAARAAGNARLIVRQYKVAGGDTDWNYIAGAQKQLKISRTPCSRTFDGQVR